MKIGRKICFMLVACVTIALGCISFASKSDVEVLLNKGLKITYNGEALRFKNVNGVVVYPISYDGTTYLPIRSISCLFKTEIEWDGDTESIYLGKGTLDTIAAETIPSFIPAESSTIVATLNSDIKIYFNNAIQTFKDVTGKVVYPISYQGTTYLPVRAISNLYGAKIEWDGVTNSVIIEKEIGNTTSDSYTVILDPYGYAKMDNEYYLSGSYSYNNQKESLSIELNKYSLEAIADYYSKVSLELTLSKSDNSIIDIRVLNRKTKEEITDLSEENLKKQFDVSYQKEVIEMTWQDKINLSSLKENVVYQYSAPAQQETLPDIINDTGSNCILYEKHYGDEYKEKLVLSNNIKAPFSFSFPTFVSSLESYDIIYHKVSIEEILSSINSGDVIFLDQYQTGEVLNNDFCDYLYNNTSRDITLEATDIMLDFSDTQTYTIKAGEIWGYDSMIDSVKVMN